MKRKKYRVYLCSAVMGVVCAVGCSGVFAGSFADGVAAYSAGDYTAAGRIFETIIASAPVGMVPVAAWFNLGNCRFREGRLGWSRYCYLRALRGRWYDPDIRHNLTFVERKAGVAEDEGPLRRLFQFPSLAHLTGAVIICNTVCFGLFTILLGVPHAPLRRWAWMSTVVLVVVAAWWMIRYHEEHRRRAIVVEETAISSAPDNVSGVRSLPLPEGEQVVILSDKNDWAAVYVPRSRTQGWVRTAALREIR